MPCFLRGRSFLLCGALFVLAPLLAHGNQTGSEENREFAFELEPGIVVKTVREAAQKAGVEVMFQKGIPRLTPTPKISGRYTIAAVLEKLLEETELVAVPVSGGQAFGIMKRKDREEGIAQKTNEPARETNFDTNMNFTKTNLLTALAASVVAMANAQDTDKEVYELSPFSVEAEEGWVANNTLAGSRLNTKVKDIASPIEILTTDFMDEFGLNSISEATIYTTNVEGLGDNYERDINYDNGTGFPPLTRVRGLGEATLSRDFFGTKMVTDNYNLERVTIAAGPNNLLFGTGSPAGVIDSSLKRAQFRNSASFQIQFDSNESQRYALDINRVLVEDKLALRIATLNNQKEYDIGPSGTDNTRYYGTLRWTPTKKTSISVHYEDAKVTNMLPSIVLPYDRISLWDNTASSGFTGPGMDVNQPAFDNPGTGDPWVGSAISNTIWNRNSNAPTVFLGAAGGLEGKTYNIRNTVQLRGPESAPAVSVLNQEADGFTLLDDTYYPTDLNLAGLQRTELVKSRLSNIFITHQFNENFSLEIAAQEEIYDGWVDGIASYTDMSRLKLDSNRFATDGVTPNPNFGKRYVESNLRSINDVTETSDWRVSLSYEKDFSKDGDTLFHRIAGKQRVAALMSENDYEYKWGFYSYYIPELNDNGVPPVFDGLTLRQPGQARWASDGTRQLRYRYYIDGNDLSPTTVARYNLGGPVTALDSNGDPFTMDPYNSGFTDEFGRRLGARNLIFAVKNHLETEQLSYQGFFWENRIVATLGWRKDTAVSADLANNPFARDPVSGYLPIVEDVGFEPYDSSAEESGNTTTRGVVVRPFYETIDLPLGAELDLIYNESSTYQPPFSSRNPLGDRVVGTAGDGNDKGFRLGLFDGKFNLRYTQFETFGGPARASNVPYNRWRARLGGPLARLMFLATGDARTPLDPAHPEMFPVLGNADPYWVTSSKLSTGKEYGIDWNVTDNFQVRFNMNRQEVVETNVGTKWWEFMEEYLPQFQALSFPEGGVDDPRDIDGDGMIGTWNWDTAWISDTNDQTIADNYFTRGVKGSVGEEFIRSLEGKPNDFVRGDRYNINAVYRFREGRLQGFSVGGAFRHRAAPVIGYRKKTVDGADFFDLNDRLYGRAEDYLDLSFNYRGETELFGFKGYRVGLNIRNVMDDDDLFSRLEDINGNPIRVGRPSEGRNFILSFTGEM